MNSFNDDIPTNPRKTYHAYIAGTVDALRKTYKASLHVAIAWNSKVSEIKPFFPHNQVQVQPIKWFDILLWKIIRLFWKNIYEFVKWYFKNGIQLIDKIYYIYKSE